LLGGGRSPAILNNTVIGVHVNSYRTIRGRTLLSVVFDEVSFWRDESSATPDIEVYRACLPSLIASNGMLIGISTPYRRMGLLHAKHRDHFGHAGDDVLVVQGSSAEFNPTLSAALIEAHRASDPESAVSEWDSQFRNDISQFLSDGTVAASAGMKDPEPAAHAHQGPGSVSWWISEASENRVRASIILNPGVVRTYV
jgi:hypothetical protein